MHCFISILLNANHFFAFGFFFSIEMIPNQLFINLTDLIFVDLSNNNLGIVK